MIPTEVGLRSYILTLSERPNDNARVWDTLPELSGMTKLGKPKELATVYARSNTDAPMLVGQDYGSGRTLAFAGDTTHLWRRTPEGVASHARFWKQIVLWLAHQEERKGNVVIKPDTRRLAAGGKLGFAVDLRGKGDSEAKEKHFDVKVI